MLEKRISMVEEKEAKKREWSQQMGTIVSQPIEERGENTRNIQKRKKNTIKMVKNLQKNSL